MCARRRDAAGQCLDLIHLVPEDQHTAVWPLPAHHGDHDEQYVDRIVSVERHVLDHGQHILALLRQAILAYTSLGYSRHKHRLVVCSAREYLRAGDCSNALLLLSTAIGYYSNDHWFSLLFRDVLCTTLECSYKCLSLECVLKSCVQLLGCSTLSSQAHGILALENFLADVLQLKRPRLPQLQQTNELSVDQNSANQICPADDTQISDSSDWPTEQFAERPHTVHITQSNVCSIFAAHCTFSHSSYAPHTVPRVHVTLRSRLRHRSLHVRAVTVTLTCRAFTAGECEASTITCVCAVSPLDVAAGAEISFVCHVTEAGDLRTAHSAICKLALSELCVTACSVVFGACTDEKVCIHLQILMGEYCAQPNTIYNDSMNLTHTPYARVLPSTIQLRATIEHAAPALVGETYPLRIDVELTHRVGVLCVQVCAETGASNDNTNHRQGAPLLLIDGDTVCDQLTTAPSVGSSGQQSGTECPFTLNCDLSQLTSTAGRGLACEGAGFLFKLPRYFSVQCRSACVYSLQLKFKFGLKTKSEQMYWMDVSKRVSLEAVLPFHVSVTYICLESMKRLSPLDGVYTLFANVPTIVCVEIHNTASHSIIIDSLRLESEAFKLVEDPILDAANRSSLVHAFSNEESISLAYCILPCLSPDATAPDFTAHILWNRAEEAQHTAEHSDLRVHSDAPCARTLVISNVPLTSPRVVDCPLSVTCHHLPPFAVIHVPFHVHFCLSNTHSSHSTLLEVTVRLLSASGQAVSVAADPPASSAERGPPSDQFSVTGPKSYSMLLTPDSRRDIEFVFTARRLGWQMLPKLSISFKTVGSTRTYEEIDWQQELTRNYPDRIVVMQNDQLLSLHKCNGTV